MVLSALVTACALLITGESWAPSANLTTLGVACGSGLATRWRWFHSCSCSSRLHRHRRFACGPSTELLPMPIWWRVRLRTGECLSHLLLMHFSVGRFIFVSELPHLSSISNSMSFAANESHRASLQWLSCTVRAAARPANVTWLRVAGPASWQATQALLHTRLLSRWLRPHFVSESEVTLGESDKNYSAAWNFSCICFRHL